MTKIKLEKMKSDLDLVHRGDVAGLDKVLEVLDLLLQLVDRNLIVLNNANDLEKISN